MKIEREITGTGWLSPSGEFIQCHTYDHIDTAEEITEHLKNRRNGIEAEDVLYAAGWISITIAQIIEHGFRFCGGGRVKPTEIQKSMLKQFIERDDVKDFISRDGIFWLRLHELVEDPNLLKEEDYV